MKMKNKISKIIIFSFLLGTIAVSCKTKNKTCAAYSKANPVELKKDKSI
jgi:hypothetical protein